MHDELMEKAGFIPANHEAAHEFEPVDIGSVFGESGQVVPGVQRVFNTETDETIAVHAGKYKLIPYSEGFAAFEEAIDRSGLDTTGMVVNTDYTHKGGRVFRQYVFPGITDPNGELALRIIMFNSYDGTSSFRGMTGFYRFVCANQSVVGQDLVRLSVRHTTNAEIGPVVEKIVASADQFVNYLPRFERMQETRLDAREGYELIQAMPGISENQADHIFARWQIDQDQDTAWGLYNAMTAWSSHKSENADVKARREGNIGRLIEAPVWAERMAA